jgi:hypothetical protein
MKRGGLFRQRKDIACVGAETTEGYKKNEQQTRAGTSTGFRLVPREMHHKNEFGTGRCAVVGCN